MPFPSLGSGNTTVGYWVSDNSSNKLIVAPMSTETTASWGSNGAVRGTTSNTDGLANTNTLVSFGTAAHPAAGYCKYLSTGGYNTWYMPAKDEITSMYSNKSVTPFSSSSDAFVISNSTIRQYYMSSTEKSSSNFEYRGFSLGDILYGGYKNQSTYSIRAIRRTNV